jgi:hypothetical protein
MSISNQSWWKSSAPSGATSMLQSVGGVSMDTSVIDTHAHWFPEEWVRLVEKEGAHCGA